MIVRASRRAVMIDAVSAIDPVDQREAASQIEVLAGLRDLPAPFEEAAGPVHITGSALVVGPRGIVLHRHKRLGLWLQPGGHLDAGEWPQDAARREAHEETGLPVRHPTSGPLLLHVDAHDGGRGHRHLDLRYLLLSLDVDPSPPQGESPDCRWFSWEEAAVVADPGLRGVLTRTRTHLVALT
ncbi:MAG TPA: NUDIX domain-containing protein [Euzebya sp.]|nr:NUDIX domain-containing protein [Euzebya sp.]